MIVFHGIPNEYGVIEEYIIADVDLPDTMASYNEIGLDFMEQLSPR